MFAIYENLRAAPGLSWMLFDWKEKLVLNGWSVAASSDGTIYSVSGDAITSGHRFGTATATPGSLTNANAWLRLRHPVQGELCMQHGTINADSWKIRYSKLGFNGGAPSASVAPTATDEVYICGSSGTFVTLLGGGGSVYSMVNYHFIVGDADEDYSWALVGTYVGSPDTQAFIYFFDRVEELEVSTDDPTVVGFTGIGSFPNGHSTSQAWTPDTQHSRAWAFMSKYGTFETQMRAHLLGGPATNFQSDAGAFSYGANPYSGEIDVYPFPLWWWRGIPGTAVPVGMVVPARSPCKGRSRIFRGWASAQGIYQTVLNVGGEAFLTFRFHNSSVILTATLLLPWEAGKRPGW